MVLPLFAAVVTQAANVHVGASATGNGSGSDWNNQAAWSSLSFTRGNVYYLAEGSYGGKTLSTATSGTTLIIIKKAIGSDHGSNTGWLSTMGDGQVAFGGQIQFTTSNWVFDGMTGGGPGAWETGYGFQITETGASNAAIKIGNSSTADNVTVRHIKTIGMDNGNSNGGAAGNDGVAVYGDTGTTISYVWTHGAGRCPFFFPPNIGTTIVEYSHVTRFWGNSNSHAETASIDTAAGDVTFRYNLIQWADSTGGIQWGDGLDGAPVFPNAKMYVYGNVFYLLSTSNHSNGTTVGTWTSGIMHHVYIYNNTFINVPDAVFYDGNGDGVDVNATNNLFYNCSSPDYGGIAHNYNHYINSGGAHSEANGTSALVGIPFLDYLLFDFRLLLNTAPGVNLGSPYNVDALGRTRTTWTRGAYEFGGTGSTPAPTATATATAAPTATVAPTATPPSTPVPTPTPGASLPPIEAESGVISAPFVISGGSISQNVTTGLSGSGRAAYSFTISQTGDYVIQAFVNGASLTANSFYLNIDAEPQDPAMEWDILPPTVGFENRLVSWRGSGTPDDNEFNPKTFHLNAGAHQVIIRGREANTQLDRFTILKLPAPPSGLQVVPTPAP